MCLSEGICIRLSRGTLPFLRKRGLVTWLYHSFETVVQGAASVPAFFLESSKPTRLQLSGQTLKTARF